MNCLEVSDRLSAFHDGELSPTQSVQIASHLVDCPTCTSEVRSFEQLSRLTCQLTDPPVPASMWAELETKLRGETTTLFDRGAAWWSNLPNRTFAIAATVLLAAGIGTVVYQFSHDGYAHGHQEDYFTNFVQAFDERPQEAQQILLASYDGRSTTLQEAASLLGYEPVVAKGLPSGFTVDQVYLLNMPCCTCAQFVCSNSTGEQLAIFEHDIDQPEWFGDRPVVECVCGGVPTSVVQTRDRLAATWKNGERYLALIGARNLEDVTEFVEYFTNSEADRT